MINFIDSEEKVIQTKCEESTSKEDKSCQTITLVTQEVIMQTSFLDFSKEISVQTNDDINYEEREKEYKDLKAKCNEVEAEYKEAHVVCDLYNMQILRHTNDIF